VHGNISPHIVIAEFKGVSHVLGNLERFSNEFRKTQTEVINPANHKKHTLPNEPIKTRSKYM